MTYSSEAINWLEKSISIIWILFLMHVISTRSHYIKGQKHFRNTHEKSKIFARLGCRNSNVFQFYYFQKNFQEIYIDFLPKKFYSSFFYPIFRQFTSNLYQW